jgi:hypothetical protein
LPEVLAVAIEILNSSDMASPIAQICRLCEPLFNSHWVPKDSLDLPDVEASTESEHDSEVDTDSEGEPYDAPDWVTTHLQSPRGYISPTHHTVSGLEESSKAGCYLCTLFWDCVRDEIARTEKSASELQALSSVAIARPATDPDFDEMVVDLELSYFENPEKSQGCAFTVGLNLYLIRRKYCSVIRRSLEALPTYL